LSVLLFLCSSPSLSPAIGKKISDQKKVFSFFVLSFFSYRVNAKKQKDIATEKEDKKTPAWLPSLFFYLVFSGRRLNHER